MAEDDTKKEKLCDAICERFRVLCKRKVSEIMSRNVKTVTDKTSFIDFAETVDKYEYKGLPVVDDQNKIVGIVTQSDILKFLLFYSSYGAKLIESEFLVGMSTVRAIRSNNAITLSPEDTIEEAAHLMFDNNIQTLPIVENGYVVGIVGKKDIIREILKAIKEADTSDLK